MSTRPRKTTKIRQRWVIVIVVVVLLVAAGALALYVNMHNTAAHTPTMSGTVTPKPGQPGNPGDEAKSEISQQMASPSPSTNPQSQSITLSALEVDSRSGGSVHVSNVLTGATSGTCTLALTAPDGSGQSAQGSILSSGTYYFCSFGTITGVSTPGTWHASLSASSANESSNSVSTTFTVPAGD